MVDRKITVVSVPRVLYQPSVVLACEVRRLVLFSSLQLLNETSSFFSPIHTKTQSKKSAEMANFCCLSDGNHAKPQSLAWCLPETINRAETHPCFTQATAQSCETVSEPGCVECVDQVWWL